MTDKEKEASVLTFDELIHPPKEDERVYKPPTILIPAHNESDQIVETLDSLWAQSTVPKRIVVIADNCTDNTAELARTHGAEVFETIENKHKKAGGLNQWLDQNLDEHGNDELIMVMDADSALDSRFLELAMKHITKGYSACGGVFTGKEGGGFVGALQRNEYARYARDVERKDGKTLVLTGTATVFTAQCLKDVVRGRSRGRLPNKGGAHVYDTTVLTEDNELTFAIKKMGHKIIAPAECKLKTEVMPTWGMLWKQRLRWKRGAIENNFQYGFNRLTLKYWFLQFWGFLGLIATSLYLFSIGAAIATGSLQLHLIWMIVTVVYMVERVVTVAARGWKQMLLAATLIVETPFDFFLQATHAKAFFDTLVRAKSDW